MPELTFREREVLDLVANGYSAKEIGAQLKIAPRTVERHTENLRLKIGARNRAHMVTLAVLSGALKIGPAPPGPRLCSECLFQPTDSAERSAAPPAPAPGRSSMRIESGNRTRASGPAKRIYGGGGRINWV